MLEGRFQEEVDGWLEWEENVVWNGRSGVGRGIIEVRGRGGVGVGWEWWSVCMIGSGGGDKSVFIKYNIYGNESLTIRHIIIVIDFFWRRVSKKIT